VSDGEDARLTVYANVSGICGGRSDDVNASMTLLYPAEDLLGSSAGFAPTSTGKCKPDLPRRGAVKGGVRVVRGELRVASPEGPVVN